MFPELWCVYDLTACVPEVTQSQQVKKYSSRPWKFPSTQSQEDRPCTVETSKYLWARKGEVLVSQNAAYCFRRGDFVRDIVRPPDIRFHPFLEYLVSVLIGIVRLVHIYVDIVSVDAFPGPSL